MLPIKCCRFLMRTMSPLKVGLIFALLIEVSSSHRLPDRTETHSSDHSSRAPSYFNRSSSYSNHQPSFFALLPLNVKITKHVHLPFAKDSVRRKAKPTLQPSRYKDSSSYRFSNTSRRNTGYSQSTTLPNIKLRSKLKVSNGTNVNSTIVYLPRLSRAMGNFSKSSVHKDLQPIIVSSHRRILIDPKHFKVKTKQNSSTNSSAFDSSLRKRDVPTYLTSKEYRNTRHGLRNAHISSENNVTRRYVNTSIRRFSSSSDKRYPENQQLPESRLFVKVVNESENGANIKKKATILQVSPTMQQRNIRLRNFKNRRRGRQFDLEVESPTNNKGIVSQIVSQTVPSILSAPEVSNQSGKHSKLFDYTYSTGIQRDWKPLINTKPSTVELENDSTPSSSENLSLTDFGKFYSEKKAKNFTIYEILKPKLKDSQPWDLTSLPSSDTDERQDLLKINPEAKESSTVSLEINEIKKESSSLHDGMVMLPGRSDFSYGIESVVVNQNDSAVILPVKSDNNTHNENLNTNKRNKSQPQDRQEPKSQPNLTKSYYHQEDEVNETQISLPTDLLRIKAAGNTVGRSKASFTDVSNSSAENIQYDTPEDVAQLDESESIRKAKMAENRVPLKNLKLDSKMFYDYFAKKPIGNVTLQDFPYPEFRPGNMFRYSDIYNREPLFDMGITRPPPFINQENRRAGAVTEGSLLTPTTTFNSLRTSLRVVSTYYPNRMQDVTMKFGNRAESTTRPANEELPEFQLDDEFDEYRDAIEPGFTMEKLAYLLIGTCCGLSILCLLVVVIAIKCRRSMVEKRIKARFKKRMYYHEKMKDMATPWHQQQPMFDHFMYMHRRPGGDSSCSRSTESCNCRCVTWSLGARNLDSMRPLFPNRSGSYLCGQKKLPFGAASTLGYESMLGRKRASPDVHRQQKSQSPHTDSSHENDSLDVDSDSREGDGPKKCTCIDYNVWPMPPPNVPRGFFTVYPNAGRYNAGGHCSQHPPLELRTISRDIPPPVTGSNYLDRSEGVVYWSSNDERLI